MNCTPCLLTTGITPLPEAVSRAMQRPMIDGHGIEARALIQDIHQGLAEILETSADVFLLPGTGSGGLEASLVNHLSPGDLVLACTHGFFSEMYGGMAQKLGAQVETLAGKWGSGVEWSALEKRLRQDHEHKIKAILITHHETSTGVLNDLAQLPIAKGSHPALVLVNALSSMGGVPVLPDSWGVDVTVMCSHKGLMCAPGLTFLAVSERATEHWKTAAMARAYWDLSSLAQWLPLGVTPFDPPLTLIYGMAEALGYLRNQAARRQVYERTAMNASLFRLCLAELPAKCLATPKDRAPNATVFQLKGDMRCQQLKETLSSEFGIAISGGMGVMARSTLRVNHQGWVFPRDMITLGTAVRLVLEATKPAQGLRSVNQARSTRPQKAGRIRRGA